MDIDRKPITYTLWSTQRNSVNILARILLARRFLLLATSKKVPGKNHGKAKARYYPWNYGNGIWISVCWFANLRLWVAPKWRTHTCAIVVVTSSPWKSALVPSAALVRFRALGVVRLVSYPDFGSSGSSLPFRTRVRSSFYTTCST